MKVNVPKTWSQKFMQSKKFLKELVLVFTKETFCVLIPYTAGLPRKKSGFRCQSAGQNPVVSQTTAGEVTSEPHTAG